MKHKKIFRQRTNGNIRAKLVRVIDSSGAQMGVVSLKEAQAKALAEGLDLIEIAPDARPPVCRIADYGKMQYEESKKKKENKKKQHAQATKTIQLSPGIGENDLQRKIADVQKFLDKGHRVVVCVTMKGRQKRHPDEAFKQIEKVKEAVDGICDNPTRQGAKITAVFMKKV